ncbi:MAG: N-6 DNA methylase [Chitinophagales bacterium]|nr:N-6 DNA methylase [Chitinophagales bacterium]
MTRDKFSVEERKSFYNAILHLDTDKDYVVADKENDTLSYTSKIKSHEKISGRPSDEELTRAIILLQLIKNYDYDSAKIEIENSFEIGGHNEERARAVETDICIKNAKGEIEILCEVKRIHKYEGTNDTAIKRQLFYPFENVVKYHKAKYLFHLSVEIPQSKEHFPLQCIGIDTSISKSYKEWEKQGKTPHFLDFNKSGEKPIIQEVFVKLEGDEQNIDKKFKDLNDDFGIDFIKRTWKNLNDYIWGGTLEDNKKFENFNRVLLAKIYDERKTKTGTPYSFQRKFKGGLPQTEEELASDIDLLYRRAYVEYLSKDKDIELSSIKGIDFKEFSISLTAKCVEQLQSISFHKNRYKNVDILGEFYEMVIRDAFKQTKGLFLTHPNIVLFILSVLEVEDVVKQKLKKPDEDPRYRLPYVIDPSCGTGTFLIHYMHYVQSYLEKNYKKIIGGDEDVKDFIERNILDKHAYKWVIDYVYGIDSEPVLATACQINLILHGDGSTNIYNADGLENFSEYAKMQVIRNANILSTQVQNGFDFYEKDCLNKFDIIISNPPFNVNINKGSIQDNFTIKGKSEAYFLERWYQLLKPGGRIGVVLPESFFSVEDDIKGRMFLYKHFNLKAVVSLPNHAFQPHTPTSTSLLFASKKTKKEEEKFKELWDKYSIEFDENTNKILKLLPANKTDVDFSIKNRKHDNSVEKIIANVEQKCTKELGKGFIVFPFFADTFLFAEENFNKLKKTLKDTITTNKDRWILFKVATQQKREFYNFSIQELGYKAGKKGSKDKPNELMTVYGKDGKKIYNIKYSHSWETIDAKDTVTVLGKIKALNLWQ